MISRSAKFALGASSALALIQAGPSYAQTTTAASKDTEIIVTARRVEERLQDVPISITVYNQVQLDKRNVTTAADLAQNTPSLSVISTQGSLNSTFSLRGFNQDLGTQPSVGIYFADVVAPRAAANQFTVGDGNGPGSFMDLQNVQVLKGPQGTLFGRNTTGGAILLVPQKPTAKFEGYLEGSYGNHNMERVQGVVNVPLSDIARFRLAAEYNNRDGYIHNYSGIGAKDFDDTHYYALRGSLVVDLTPDLENYTIVSYAKSNINGSAQPVVASLGSGYPYGLTSAAQLARQAAAGKGFYDIFNTYAPKGSDFEQWQVINTTTWHASDTLTIKNIASYAQLKETLVTPFLASGFDAHDSPLPVPGLPAPPVGTYFSFAGSNTLPGYNTANQSTFTDELQLQGNALDDRLTYQAGVYIEQSDPLGTSAIISNIGLNCVAKGSLLCSNPLGFGTTSITANQIKFRNEGLYAQATYKLTNQFSLTGGIRYTWDKVSGTGTNFVYKYGLSNTPTLPTSSACTYPNQPNCQLVGAKQISKAPTWLIDLDYKPTNDLLFYAKWTRGFRAGNLALGLPAQFVNLQPEHLDAYEVGGKTSFRGSSVSGHLNVAAFYNNFRNEQAGVTFVSSDPSFPLKTGSTNVGKSRIYGAEIEGSLTFLHALTLDASYSYLNTKVQRITTPSLTGSVYSISSSLRVGDSLPYTPRNKLSVNATYLLPLPQSVGEISVGGTYTYTGKQLSTYTFRDTAGHTTDADNLAARNLVDANLSWRKVAGSRFDVLLFVTNLTNKKYFSYILPVPNLVEFAQIGEPRMFGARVKYSW